MIGMTQLRNARRVTVLALPFVIALFVSSSALAQPASSFFVPNQGQWDGDFLFRYQGPGMACFVTRTGMTLDFREYTPLRPPSHPPSVPPIEWREGRLGSFLHSMGEDRRGSLRGHVLRLSFVDANPSPECIGADKLSSYSNFFLGRDSCRWRGFVPNYQKVVAREVWPGIDVEYLTHEDGVETLFRAKPGADISQIALEYEGLERPLELDALGNLILHTSLGVVKEKAPWACQITGSRRAEVPVSFRVLSNTRYALTVGQHDASVELVIDPRVIYSSCFGDGGDVYDISLDSEGNLVIVGTTGSPTFPVTPGALQDTIRGSGDAYLSKLTPDGHSLVYSTYLGGIAGSEHLLEVVVDAQDRMMAGGGTYSEDWPLTEGAFDTLMVGPEPVFVCFSADGSELLYSTFTGGSGIDWIWDLALDTLSGEVYACGEAGEDFPLTPDAVYPTRVGGSSFVWVFNPAVMQVVYSTYFPATQEGGGGVYTECVVPVGGRVVWLAGEVSNMGYGMVTPDALQPEYGGEAWDGYFAQCDLTGPGVVYGSYLGGIGVDECRLRRYPSGDLLLFGYTSSSNFPVTPGAFDTLVDPIVEDAFISVLQPPRTLLHSTFLGGYGSDKALDAVLTAGGEVIVVGFASSLDFPLTEDAFDTVVFTDPHDATDDGFVSKLSADLSQLLFSTFWGGHLGGMGSDIIERVVWEGEDSVWVSGVALSCDFPTTPDAFQPCYCYDGFISHFYVGTGSGAALPRALAPDDLTLSCYPNPFNATAVLRFTLPRAGNARLLVFDLLGRKVLDENLGKLPAGEHRHTLDASDLPSGIYFARLEALGNERVQKMVILR